MRNTTLCALAACVLLTTGSTGLFGQARQRQAAPNRPSRPPITRDRQEDVRDRRENGRDRREDVRDRREDVRDRREDVVDKREDVRDRREDVRDAKTDGGIRDQREDVLDRREDVRDRREDVRDRREDVIDRREDVRDRREDVRDRFENVIDHNPAFARRVHNLLPPGVKPGEAITGFKNQGQFLSALHASKNLNIPFGDLKSKLVSSDDMTLGKAIHELRPGLSEDEIRGAVQRSEHEAGETEKAAGSAD
jgi:hypothetical protein